MYAFEQDKTHENKNQESYVEKHTNKKNTHTTLTMVRFSLCDKLKCTAKKMGISQFHDLLEMRYPDITPSNKLISAGHSTAIVMGHGVLLILFGI